VFTSSIFSSCATTSFSTRIPFYVQNHQVTFRTAPEGECHSVSSIQYPVPVLHSRLYYSLTIRNAQDQSCSNQEQWLGHASKALLRL
jgi:hypothetical protein